MCAFKAVGFPGEKTAAHRRNKGDPCIDEQIDNTQPPGQKEYARANPKNQSDNRADKNSFESIVHNFACFFFYMSLGASNSGSATLAGFRMH